ncbi:MAG: sortase [Clostridiales bacterium]|nr:sortase [Clostridiales bacterium]
MSKPDEDRELNQEETGTSAEESRDETLVVEDLDEEEDAQDKSDVDEAAKVKEAAEEAGEETGTEEGDADTRPAEAGDDAKEEAAPARRKKSNLIYNLILVAGVCMLIGGGIAIYQKYKGDADTKDMYNSLEDTFVSVVDTEEETEIDWGIEWVSGDDSNSYTSSQWYNTISVDFDGLNSINEDVVGWVYQENGSISYPLLYSGDNDKYLRKTLYGVTSTSGSVFIGGENDPSFSDPLTMIYGHNMKNGSMFGSLKKYKNEEDYFEEHQYFQVYTEDGMAYRYQVFAYFDIKETEGDMEEIQFYDTEDPESAIVSELVTITTVTTTITGEGATEMVTEIVDSTEYIANEGNTYEAYLETIKERSLIETDLEVTTDDQIIGLFTCSSSSGNRFLVFAVKVDEHNFNEETSNQTSDLESLDR